MPTTLTLSPKVHSALRVYPVEFARHFGVSAFVTDRFGGVSVPPYESLNLGDHVGDDAEHVRQNRRLVADAISVDPARLVIVNQNHGTDVVLANEVTPDSAGDVIVDFGDEFAIAVLVADCVPLLLVDEDSPALAVVHAGWKGLQHGVIVNALRNFDHPNAVHVFIGPCISGEAYQVGPEVATQFASVAGAVLPDSDDRSRLDLRVVAIAQLLEHGVTDDHVAMSAQTTDGGETFFSDRAQRPCGRFALVAKRIIA